MRKNLELECHHSCLNKADGYELLFVLIGRDECAPWAIDAWISRRIELGLNHPDDKQIIEARQCAEAMVKERNYIRNMMGKE